jgi:Amt family ammonium transporter
MEEQVQQLVVGLDTIWVVLTAAMILLMEGGFALLEAGFVRQKNAVSIIMKIFADIAFGALVFFTFGFALMFGKDVAGLIGTSGFMLSGDLSHITGLNITLETYWVFQCAFVIAVISIVSGAVAERIKFYAYILFIVVMTGLIYPIAGHWVWSGGGWLGKLGIDLCRILIKKRYGLFRRFCCYPRPRRICRTRRRDGAWTSSRQI